MHHSGLSPGERWGLGVVGGQGMEGLSRLEKTKSYFADSAEVVSV